MSKLVIQDIAFRSNQQNKIPREPDFQSLDLQIMFEIYQDLMFKELLNLKQNVHTAVNNFEKLVLEFQNLSEDIF